MTNLSASDDRPDLGDPGSLFVEEQRFAVVQEWVIDVELETLTGEDAPVAAAAKNAVAKAGVALQDRLDAKLTEAVNGISRKIDHRDPTSPLGHLVGTLREEQAKAIGDLSEQQKDVLGRLEALQTAVIASGAAAKSAAQAVAASPLKGLPYQQAVHQVLRTVASANGDEYEDTSGRTGRMSGNKKGDGV
jgi:hypothetical protein